LREKPLQRNPARNIVARNNYKLVCAGFAKSCTVVIFFAMVLQKILCVLCFVRATTGNLGYFALLHLSKDQHLRVQQ
jgi:hypothetical protein